MSGIPPRRCGWCSLRSRPRYSLRNPQSVERVGEEGGDVHAVVHLAVDDGVHFLGTRLCLATSDPHVGDAGLLERARDLFRLRGVHLRGGAQDHGVDARILDPADDLVGRADLAERVRQAGYEQHVRGELLARSEVTPLAEACLLYTSD